MTFVLGLMLTVAAANGHVTYAMAAMLWAMLHATIPDTDTEPRSSR